jgi:predicted ATP-grasp superfamily ATP-dependent carboligase
MTATATVSNFRVGATREVSNRPATAGALVLGADYRSLGVARSLGRRGIPVWVFKEGGHLVAATSRYVSRRVSWPFGDDNARIEFLLELASTHDLNGWMLVPTDDHAVALIYQHHELLASKYRLTVPPWEQLRSVCDKRLLSCMAGRLKIHQPWTSWPSCREELASLDCPFPVILKPAVRLHANNLSTPKAWRAEDRSALLGRYDEACKLIPPENLIVQEVVPGGGEAQFSYAAMCKDGYPLASVVAKRRRQYPLDFGQFSTLVETVDEPKVIEPATRLLSAIGFTGLVEVEFKEDLRNGEYKVLDVNPRVWGWHTLSRRAGVDFPYLLWLLVKGDPVPEARGRAGECWMHMSADLPMAFQEIRKGRLSLMAYLRSLLKPMESAIFAWDDPAPGLLDLPLLAWTLAKRFLRRDGN